MVFAHSSGDESKPKMPREEVLVARGKNGQRNARHRPIDELSRGAVASNTNQGPERALFVPAVAPGRHFIKVR